MSNEIIELLEKVEDLSSSIEEYYQGSRGRHALEVEQTMVATEPFAAALQAFVKTQNKHASMALLAGLLAQVSHDWNE